MAVNFNDWCYYKKGVVSNRSPLVELTPNYKECRCLMKHFKAWFVMYNTDFNAAEETKYWGMLKEGKVDFNRLNSSTRSRINKCLSACEIKQIAPEILKELGYRVYLIETGRYAKKGFPTKPVSEDEYRQGVDNNARKGYHFWGVFCEGILISYYIVEIRESVLVLLVRQADYQNYNHVFPSYGMVYTVLEHYLNSGKCDYALSGFRTLSQHSNAQLFMQEKFGFKKAYCNLHVTFRWFLYPPIWILYVFRKYIKHRKLIQLIRLYDYSH